MHPYFDLGISGDGADVQNSAATLLFEHFDLDDPWAVAAYSEAVTAVAAVETNKYAQRTTARCNVIALSHFYCATHVVAFRIVIRNRCQFRPPEGLFLSAYTGDKFISYN